MKQMVDFEECLKDSPRFRSSLEENESSIHAFEHHLEKLVKLCTNMVDTGNAFSSALGSVSHSFESLASILDGDKLVVDAISKLCNTLSGFQAFLKVMTDQGQRTLVHGIQRFVKEDIKKVKDTKKVFDKISDDLDNVFLRNAQLPKNSKMSDVEEVENILTATESCFSHTALDYAFQINVLQSRKRLYLVEKIQMFMGSESLFFRQGHELLENLHPYVNDLQTKLSELSEEFNSDVKEMEERHTLVQKKNAFVVDVVSKSLSKDNSAVVFEGYLYKRASNAFKTWKRRWFSIQNNKVFYQKRLKDAQTELVDVRLSTVKHADTLDRTIDRRFCFAIVCPTKCWYLQASTETERKNWIGAMQLSIAKALNESTSHSFNDLTPNDKETNNVYHPLEKLHPQYLLSQIRCLPGNDICCDCGSPNPKWASINYGIIMCIECSGIHRSLGVHLSKVRSITLDDWEPETQKLMIELGNKLVNLILEACIPQSVSKPTPTSPRAEKETWIRNKYGSKAYVNPPSLSTPNKKSRLRRKPKVQTDSNGKLKAYGIDNSRERTTSLEKGLEKVHLYHIESESDNKDDETVEGRSTTPSSDHQYSTGSNTSEEERETLKSQANQRLFDAAGQNDLSTMTLAIAQGANVNWKNDECNSMTALHQSVFSKSVTASELLLQNGARVNLRDQQGRAPLHHAALLGLTGHACLFLKRGAQQEAVDENGEDVLKIALKSYQADIVTLLRLAKLSEDMDTDIGGDETFTNVFRDISTIASQTPEKLNRKQDDKNTSA